MFHEGSVYDEGNDSMELSLYAHVRRWHVSAIKIISFARAHKNSRARQSVSELALRSDAGSHASVLASHLCGLGEGRGQASATPLYTTLSTHLPK